jgi:hypothetical protein
VAGLQRALPASHDLSPEAQARERERVLDREQFPLGHNRGASHDHGRFIRGSCHAPGYVRLAGLALHGGTGVDLGPFDAGRVALTMPTPDPNYLV